jgi:hypothetical protein
MEERLERVLSRVIDWLKYEEAKNGALVTLDAVGAGLIAQWLSSASNLSAALSPWLKGSLVALLLSLTTSLVSFYPVLRGGRLHRSAARRRSRLSTPNSSSLFFAEIAGTEPAVYLNQLRAAVGDPSNGTPLELDYASEIVHNAEITLMKLRVFQVALVISVLGFIATCVAAIVYL